MNLIEWFRQKPEELPKISPVSTHLVLSARKRWEESTELNPALTPEETVAGVGLILIAEITDFLETDYSTYLKTRSSTKSKNRVVRERAQHYGQLLKDAINVNEWIEKKARSQSRGLPSSLYLTLGGLIHIMNEQFGHKNTRQLAKNLSW